MLGPSITVAGIPFSLGYSFNASRRAKDRGVAYVALGLSVLEVAGVGLLLAMALVL